MMKRIVIPVRPDGKSRNVLAHAAALARRYDAHVVITHCRPRAEDMMPFGVPISASMKKLLLAQSGEVANAEEEGLREELRSLTDELGLALSDEPLATEASASWVEQEGRQVDVIKRHGRLADIICVAKPDVSRNLGMNTLKAALFNTGRPVMMCPPTDTPPGALCERVSIAWNGSSQASRAVALTLPIIERADEVVVLTSGSEIHGAEADDLVDYLAARGVTARIERFVSRRKNVGAELLRLSAEHGADTMIMGAYSESHERESMFGGNTQHIVDQAKTPVIMVH